MAGQVLHHPRLAWDGARMFVRAWGAYHLYGWLGNQCERVLGTEYRRALFESWERLWDSDRPDAEHVEAGRWRARLEDLLRFHPELATPLRDLIRETSARLDEAPVRRPG
jgi:hypothetical protein